MAIGIVVMCKDGTQFEVIARRENEAEVTRFANDEIPEKKNKAIAKAVKRAYESDR